MLILGKLSCQCNSRELGIHHPHPPPAHPTPSPPHPRPPHPTPDHPTHPTPTHPTPTHPTPPHHPTHPTHMSRFPGSADLAVTVHRAGGEARLEVGALHRQATRARVDGQPQIGQQNVDCFYLTQKQPQFINRGCLRGPHPINQLGLIIMGSTLGLVPLK